VFTLTLTLNPDKFAVSPSRLVFGRWNETKQRDEGEGDIYASYSADRIGANNSIRKPFRCGDSLWVCTSITGKYLTQGGQQEFEAYTVVPKLLFNATPTTYNAKSSVRDGEMARKDPKGFYHGMAVKHAGETFVLAGPPAMFVAAEAFTPEGVADNKTEQLSLF
jgi:hypothetical protein